MKGLVVKAISGFFYVECENEEIFECNARGNLKSGKNKVKVGDIVEISESEKVISKVFPRKNDFIRPDISNVDSFFLIFSIKEPNLNLYLLDKFLVMAKDAGTEITICISKADIATKQELENISKIYDNLYNTIFFSSKEGVNIAEIEMIMAGKKVALTGPSGAGKSTLTNLLLGAQKMDVGNLSDKTGRGKHTTRHSQIFHLKNGAMLFDTPGFTAFETASMEERDLKYCYPEFDNYAHECKYDNCNHINEPECGVASAVLAGEIAKSRYESYTKQFFEIAERNKKW